MDSDANQLDQKQQIAHLVIRANHRRQISAASNVGGVQEQIWHSRLPLP